MLFFFVLFFCFVFWFVFYFVLTSLNYALPSFNTNHQSCVFFFRHPAVYHRHCFSLFISPELFVPSFILFPTVHLKTLCQTSFLAFPPCFARCVLFSFFLFSFFCFLLSFLKIFFFPSLLLLFILACPFVHKNEETKTKKKKKKKKSPKTLLLFLFCFVFVIAFAWGLARDYLPPMKLSLIITPPSIDHGCLFSIVWSFHQISLILLFLLSSNCDYLIKFFPVITFVIDIIIIIIAMFCNDQRPHKPNLLDLLKRLCGLVLTYILSSISIYLFIYLSKFVIYLCMLISHSLALSHPLYIYYILIN